jgi:hypothetical protein
MCYLELGGSGRQFVNAFVIILYSTPAGRSHRVETYENDPD